jgi:hypothetical protein
MLGRTGATQFQIRYCEEEQPIIWMAAASWDGHWEVAASMSPLDAIFRLCDQVVDGGTCAHCGKPTGFVPDSEGLMPGQELICWYRFDPELKTFRRGCEGVSP